MRALELVKQFYARYPPQTVLPPASAQDIKPKAGSEATKVPAVNAGSPSASLPPSVRLPSTSFPTRVALEAKRPLVRLTSNSQIPDNTIPPFLDLHDIELLHHRLVAQASTGPEDARKAKSKDVKFLTWVCRSYGGALQKRRSWVVNG